MKKKFLSMFIVLAMLSAFIPMTVSAGNIDDLYYTLIDNNSAVEITSCSNTATDITVPDTIEGLPVTKIGFLAFSNASAQLRSVTLPNSITTIGEAAFSNCTSLVKINIPANVTCINTNVFANCSSLASIDIPNSVTSIGYSAFGSCSSLTNINIPDSVTSIDTEAFSGCSSLTSIVLPDSVTTVGEDVFRACTNLESMVLSKNIEVLPYGFACDCISLNNVVLPEHLKKIEDKAFGYTALQTVDMPDEIESLSVFEDSYDFGTPNTNASFYGSESVVMRCRENSYIHKTAEKYNFPYVLIPDGPDKFDYDNHKYEPKLAMQCANFAASAYGTYRNKPYKEIFYQLDSEDKDTLNNQLYYYNLTDSKVGCLGDDTDNDVQYTFAHKKAIYNGEEKEITFVILRGVTGDS